MHKRGKKVCLITPNHISTNPRLVKEALALESHGFAVHLIFTQSDVFETELDKLILNQHPEWTYDVLDWSGKTLQSRIFRFIFGLTKKFSEKIFLLVKLPLLANFIVNRNYLWQLNKAMTVRADLYVAHNLGALPIARKVAMKCNKKFGFDAEDFHRHESNNNPNDQDVIVKSMVEENNLLGMDHFTAASPLIAKAYQQLFQHTKPSVILNVFPKIKPAEKLQAVESQIKLFWFSQTLGSNRGIETVVCAMGLTKAKMFELHLLGKPLPGYKKKLEELAISNGIKGQLFFYNPVPEKELFRLASSFDIGVASETGVPYNRDICLTNKIFTYVQTGLALVASDTKAQKEFCAQYPSVGKIYQNNNPASLASILDYLHENREELKAYKDSNYQLGQTELNWEIEQVKYLSSINKVFNMAEEPLLQ